MKKDIKSGCAEKNEPTPTATVNFMRGAWEQLQDKPKSEITADDVSDAVMNIVGQTTKFDGKSAICFRKL